MKQKIINKEEIIEVNGIKLKPFNLEEAKAGRPVYTRDGLPVRILCYDLDDEYYPIVAAIKYLEGREVVRTFTNTGSYNLVDNTRVDLMIKTETKEGWINVYKNVLHSTEKEAKLVSIDKGYVGTFKVTWEE